MMNFKFTNSFIQTHHTWKSSMIKFKVTGTRYTYFKPKSSFCLIFSCDKCCKILKSINRSCHRRCSIKRGALKDFAIFTGKNLCRSLFFNKVAGLKPVNLLKDKFHEFLRALIAPNVFFIVVFSLKQKLQVSKINIFQTIWKLFTLQ